MSRDARTQAFLVRGAFVTLVGVAGVACSPAESPRVATPAQGAQPLFGCTVWQENSHFSDEVKGRLEHLDSLYGVCVQPWDKAGTVLRLTVGNAPSEAPAGSTLIEHARAFIDANRMLWRLEDLPSTASLEVVGEPTAGNSGGCRQVTLQLVRSDTPVGPRPIFNASLRVAMTEDGHVQEVVGRMQPSLSEMSQGVLEMDTAAEIVRQHFPQAPSVDTLLEPRPEEVVVDPFFLGMSEGPAPALAWQWRDRVPNEQAVVVSQATSTVLAPNKDIPTAPIAEHQCPGADPTYWSSGKAWRRDTALSSAQKARLHALELESQSDILVETWARAGTVYRLDLDVSSGASAGSSLTAHALAFVARNLALWRLQSVSPLTVFGERSDGACSSVTLQLSRGGVAVHNATLTVLVSPQGRIHGVTGRMSGDALTVRTGTMTAAQARTQLATELDWLESATELPGAVISAPSSTTTAVTMRRRRGSLVRPAGLAAPIRRRLGPLVSWSARVRDESK